MKRVGKLIVASLCVAWIDAGLGVGQAQDQVASAANAARFVNVDQLLKIYAGKTWLWEDGAGYFGTRDRTFIAWTNEGPTASYADGSWQLTDKGLLCFSAFWRAINGGRQARTCFEHRADDKRIYQRRLPRGGWYVFGHLPTAEAEDELQKLKEGNLITANYERNKRYVSENRKKRRGPKRHRDRNRR